MLHHKIDLPSVTYCCADGRISERIIKIIIKNAEYAIQYIKFKDVVILTPYQNHVEHPTIKFIHIDPINSIYEYSQFCLRELHKHIKSKHCLLFQWDGCISNPYIWDNDFLKYDYIGAPWSQNAKWIKERYDVNSDIVGNGGFSLRSLKLLYECRNMRLLSHEDAVISLIYRKALIDKGLKFADAETGKRFAIEEPIDNRHKYITSFGFHGRTQISKFWEERKWI